MPASRVPSRPVRRSCSRRCGTSSAVSSVEALTTGTPVVVSPMTGAVGTIVRDGLNGIVVDPYDARSLAAAMHRATDPATSRALRDGVGRMNPPLLPDAAAGAVLRAVARARAANHSRPEPERRLRVQNAQTPTASRPPCASARSSRCAAPRRSWPRSTRTASSTGCRSCPRCWRGAAGDSGSTSSPSSCATPSTGLASTACATRCTWKRRAATGRRTADARRGATSTGRRTGSSGSRPGTRARRPSAGRPRPPAAR